MKKNECSRGTRNTPTASFEFCNESTYVYRLSSVLLNLTDIIVSKLKDISKIKWNYSNYKTETKAKLICNSPDFKYMILEILNDKSKEEIHNRVSFWLEYADVFIRNKQLFKIKINENIKKSQVFGSNGEKHALNLIKTVFGGNVMQTQYIYTKFDFYNESYLFEVKTRNICSSKFKTALINTGKIIDRNIIFMFQYLDKILYIRYDKEIFDTFEIEYTKKLNTVLTTDDVYHIPIYCLTEINSDSKIVLPLLYTDTNDIENRIKLIEEDHTNFTLYNTINPKI